MPAKLSDEIYRMIQNPGTPRLGGRYALVYRKLVATRCKLIWQFHPPVASAKKADSKTRYIRSSLQANASAE